MKDPSGVHYETSLWQRPDWEGSDSLCDSCLTAWPCDTWEKWTQSKDYRLNQAEAEIGRLAGDVKRLNALALDLSDKLKKQELLMNGIRPALSDLVEASGGRLEVVDKVEMVDVSAPGDVPARHVPGLRELRVTYRSPDGANYINGVFESQVYRRP